MRLRTWVKFTITVMVLALILYLRNVVIYTNINIIYKELYWFVFIPLNFVGLTLMWEK